MTTINITYGKQDRTNQQLELPVISLMEIRTKHLEVIRGLVFGTESNSWLKVSEDKVNGRS